MKQRCKEEWQFLHKDVRHTKNNHFKLLLVLETTDIWDVLSFSHRVLWKLPFLQGFKQPHREASIAVGRLAFFIQLRLGNVFLSFSFLTIHEISCLIKVYFRQPQSAQQILSAVLVIAAMIAVHASAGVNHPLYSVFLCCFFTAVAHRQSTPSHWTEPEHQTPPCVPLNAIEA